MFSAKIASHEFRLNITREKEPWFEWCLCDVGPRNEVKVCFELVDDSMWIKFIHSFFDKTELLTLIVSHTE